MSRLKLLLSFILLVSVIFVFPQQPVLHWAKSFEPYAQTITNGRTVGVDEQGNVYSAGFLEGSYDFDPGPGVHIVTGTGPANYGIYISKLDANGNFVWASQIPVLLEFSQIELKVDKAGNIYLTSDTRVEADVDPGPGVYTLKLTGFRDAFVLKIDTDGNLVWAKQFGGPGDTGPQATMVEIDAESNVIVAGLFNNTCDFDPGPGVLNLTSSAHFQAFLVKLNNDGGLIWAKQLGNGPEIYSGCTIIDLKCDLGGNIVATGFFSRTCDFDPGTGVYNVTSSAGGQADAFIYKLDKNCNFIWVRTFIQHGTNNHFIQPTGIDIDGMNNIITTGIFIGDYDFDPGPGDKTVYANPWEYYISKLDAQGNYLWSHTLGNNGYDQGNDVVVDADNNIYSVGNFSNTVDFDPGPGTFTYNCDEYGTSALLKFDPDGNFKYAALFPGPVHSTSGMRRMAIDPARNIYIAGTGGYSIDYDPGSGVVTIPSGPFVLKYGPCFNASTSVLTVNACSSYMLNSQTYIASGTYVQTIPNATGCDSTITLHLVINNKKTEQTKSICEGSYFFAGGSNQNAAGIYYDTLTTTMGCDSVVITQIAIDPRPVPNLGADRDLCKNMVLKLTPGTFQSYVWQNNSIAATLPVTAPGFYWVKVTNNFQCSTTDTIRILTLLDPPANFLKKTDSLCAFKTLDLLSLNNYSRYQWSTGADSKIVTIQNPGKYWLTVTDANGCIDTDTTTIFDKQCQYGVYIPTAFTPDNNGKNDLFRPSIFGRLLKYHIAVYDRLGNLVFESNDAAKGWDGRLRGMTQENGAFVWICSYHLQGSAPKSEKGTVLLLR